MKLNHIAIIITKEENLEFYRLTGFEEYWRTERKNDKVVLMRSGDIALEVFIDPSHPQRASGPEQNGLRHFAISVGDVEAVREKLAAYEPEEIRTDWFGKKFFFVKDPDGQPMEFKEA